MSKSEWSESGVLNFKPNNYHELNSGKPITDLPLFFTQNVNEPQRINYSNSLSISFTFPGSAFPFMAFIVCPTRKPIAFSLPLR